MKKKFSSKKIASLGLAVALSLSSTIVIGHPGRTDSSGGHKDNKNKSGLGSYHYHCGGNTAHLHKDGVCPYSSKTSTKKPTTSSKKSSSSTKSEDIKKAQEKLNELGYDCGKADGIMGKKSKEALKKFQKDNKLTVDGILGSKSKEALGI